MGNIIDRFKKFVFDHKTEIAIGTTFLAVGVVATVFGVKKLFDGIPTDGYTQEWLESLSKEALDLEREKERLAFCSSGSNLREASIHQYHMDAIDRELYRRRPKLPEGPIIHREHGWNLLKND